MQEVNAALAGKLDAGKVTQSGSVTQPGYAVDARQMNAAVEGTMAYELGKLKNPYSVENIVVTRPAVDAHGYAEAHASFEVPKGYVILSVMTGHLGSHYFSLHGTVFSQRTGSAEIIFLISNWSDQPFLQGQFEANVVIGKVS